MYLRILYLLNVKQKNSIDVEASTCGQRCKTMAAKNHDAQNNDPQHYDV